ncbi:MAG: hypothetical protein O7173_02595, partial [Wolbachia endosymbiont of Nomada fabriciana]|nr:hypothetical protein [Wolbachia endosymbiont of Nomada fabriciana]
KISHSLSLISLGYNLPSYFLLTSSYSFLYSLSRQVLRNELLLDAVKRKDRSGVEAQLDKGANVNYVRREDGCAPCCQL